MDDAGVIRFSVVGGEVSPVLIVDMLIGSAIIEVTASMLFGKIGLSLVDSLPKINRNDVVKICITLLYAMVQNI